MRTLAANAYMFSEEERIRRRKRDANHISRAALLRCCVALAGIS
jgi:hypothetical protein